MRRLYFLLPVLGLTLSTIGIVSCAPKNAADTKSWNPATSTTRENGSTPFDNVTPSHHYYDPAKLPQPWVSLSAFFGLWVCLCFVFFFFFFFFVFVFFFFF